jgi:hypothetical protein
MKQTHASLASISKVLLNNYCKKVVVALPGANWEQQNRYTISSALNFSDNFGLHQFTCKKFTTFEDTYHIELHREPSKLAKYCMRTFSNEAEQENGSMHLNH